MTTHDNDNDLVPMAPKEDVRQFHRQAMQTLDTVIDKLVRVQAMKLWARERRHERRVDLDSAVGILRDWRAVHAKALTDLEE